MPQQQQHSGSKPHAANRSSGTFSGIRPSSEMLFRMGRLVYARGPLEAFVAGCIYGPERSVCVTCQGIWDAHARRTILAASFDADVCLSASLSFFVVRVVVFRVIGRTLFSYMPKQQRHHAHPGAICWTQRDPDATRPCTSSPCSAPHGLKRKRKRGRARDSARHFLAHQVLSF